MKFISTHVKKKHKIPQYCIEKNAKLVNRLWEKIVKLVDRSQGKIKFHNVL